MLTLALNFLELFYFGDFWSICVGHCNVAWLVSVALTSLCRSVYWCLLHDGVMVSGVGRKKLHVKDCIRQKYAIFVSFSHTILHLESFFFYLH